MRTSRRRACLRYSGRRGGSRPRRRPTGYRPCLATAVAERAGARERRVRRVAAAGHGAGAARGCIGGGAAIPTRHARRPAALGMPGAEPGGEAVTSRGGVRYQDAARRGRLRRSTPAAPHPPETSLGCRVPRRRARASEAVALDRARGGLARHRAQRPATSGSFLNRRGRPVVEPRTSLATCVSRRPRWAGLASGRGAHSGPRPAAARTRRSLCGFARATRRGVCDHVEHVGAEAQAGRAGPGADVSTGRRRVPLPAGAPGSPRVMARSHHGHAPPPAPVSHHARRCAYVGHRRRPVGRPRALVQGDARGARRGSMPRATRLDRLGRLDHARCPAPRRMVIEVGAGGQAIRMSVAQRTSPIYLCRTTRPPCSMAATTVVGGRKPLVARNSGQAAVGSSRCFVPIRLASISDLAGLCLHHRTAINDASGGVFAPRGRNTLI